VRSTLSRLSLVPLVGLVVFASACSSPAPKPTASVKTTTNTGLCKLVVPSVVATALEQSVNYPVTLRHGATTECAYPGIHTTSTAVIIRYDTGISAAGFARSRTSFERRGLKLGPISGLGDEAYYFATQAGHATVTTVVLRKGYLQVLVTGTGALDPIGSIARYTLAQYEETHTAPAASG
jgi:hypothetical protein